MVKHNESIGDGIDSKKGLFTFDEKVAQHFDQHVRRSVPFYDELQRMIVEMSDWFVHEDSIIYDLGCSVGETIKNLYQKHYDNKHPIFTGIDSSEAMLNQARMNLAGLHNISFFRRDLNQAIEICNASLVTILYTLQFIRPENRFNLVKNIYQSLLDNGALIIVEKIVGNNPRFDELWIELYNDLKLRNELTLSEIKAKSDSLRGILLSYSQDKNIKMLRDSGFDDIDIFFKWYNFIGIIAVK